ncbi:MAG TPA: winged helix-turn-helix domain-containing protein [Terracidiphilus sp.]
MTSSRLAEKLETFPDPVIAPTLDTFVIVNREVSRKASFSPYEFDRSSGILTRSGIRLRLESQPARVLKLLLDASPQMVTRAEMISELWHGETEGDFDRRLDKAVAKLRASLNDDPLKPRFVETIKGRGYRFVAEVASVAPREPFPTDGNIQSPEQENGRLPGKGAIDGTVAAGTPVDREALPLRANATAGDFATAPAIFSRRWKFAFLVILAAVVLAGFVLCFRWLPANSGRDVHSTELEFERVTISGDVKSADISPDGKYVAYARIISGQESLWLRQLATGRVLQVTSLGTDQCSGIDFSPDGNYLYFERHRPSAAGGDLYRISILGGDATRVLTGISGAPAISPDGLKVAFVRSTLMSHGVDSVVTANTVGSDVHVLASYPAPGIHFNRLTWTADGQTLIFSSRNMLIALPVNGGAARPLSFQPWHWIDDVWGLGPDSTLVVVGQLGDFKRSQLYLIPLAGGTVRAITQDLTNYISIRGTADGKALIGLHKIVSSTLQTLAPGQDSDTHVLSSENETEDGGLGLAWAPDGRIAYITQSDRQTLTVVNSDGSNPRQYISTSSDGLSDVAASPKEDSLVFVRWSQGDRASLYRIDLQDGRQTRLTAGTQDFSPSFTPDGESVVYAGIQADKTVLMKVPTQGGTPTVLTSYNADHPSVSPNGEWIACWYVPQSDQPPVLAILPITGGPPTRTFIVPPTATASPLAWTPDGRAVSFVNHEKGVSNIWQQPVSAGSAVAITHFKSGTIFNFQWSRDGRLALSRGSEVTDAVLIKNFR